MMRSEPLVEKQYATSVKAFHLADEYNKYRIENGVYALGWVLNKPVAQIKKDLRK